jgi:hypothetical protein
MSSESFWAVSRVFFRMRLALPVLLEQHLDVLELPRQIVALVSGGRAPLGHEGQVGPHTPGVEAAPKPAGEGLPLDVHGRDLHECLPLFAVRVARAETGLKPGVRG